MRTHMSVPKMSASSVHRLSAFASSVPLGCPFYAPLCWSSSIQIFTHKIMHDTGHDTIRLRPHRQHTERRGKPRTPRSPVSTGRASPARSMSPSSPPVSPLRRRRARSSSFNSHAEKTVWMRELQSGVPSRCWKGVPDSTPRTNVTLRLEPSEPQDTSLAWHEVPKTEFNDQRYDGSIPLGKGEQEQDAGSKQRPSSNVFVRIYTRVLAACQAFPDSVTPDYLEYQVWDTIQAVSSYLRGILCTKAVLVGAGVGSEGADATSAAVQWVFRDGLGMFGGMIFAWAKAGEFGTDIKRWRFFADCINDVGLSLMLFSPVYPSLFLPIAAAGSVCFSVCGVAAGATKAALSQHFAKRNNLADISAKEGIQETCVTLIGLVVGLYYADWIAESSQRTWTVFVLLMALHVFANYKGMCALSLTSINRQRAQILVDEYLASSRVLSPQAVARREGVVWGGDNSIVLGARVNVRRMTVERAMRGNHQGLYIVDSASQGCCCFAREEIAVYFHRQAGAQEQLLALMHARALQMWQNGVSDNFADVENEAKLVQRVRTLFRRFWERELTESGWDLSVINLGHFPYTYEWILQ